MWSSGYDRVTYSDKLHFSSPIDAQEYRDQNSNGHADGYVYDFEPKGHGKPFVRCCDGCTKTKKICALLLGIAIILMTFIVIVLVTKMRHTQSNTQNMMPKIKKYGLIAYGPDENSIISFNPVDQSSYKKFLNKVEFYVNDYSSISQYELDVYVKCNENTTEVPEGKVCMQTMDEFGEDCQHQASYGITKGRPCVLLVLKLEPGLVPKPLKKESTQNQAVLQKLGSHYHADSVGISCEGREKADSDAINMELANTHPVTYNPDGFPLYYFVQKVRPSKYISPAVMVQFNTVPTNRYVNILCTAWAENFDDGHPQSSLLYSTAFTFYIHGQSK